MMRIAPKVLALVVVVAAIAYFLLRPPFQTADDGHPELQPRPAEGVASLPAPGPSVAPTKEPGVNAPAIAPAATAQPRTAVAGDDLVAMETLRELLNSEPRRAIELARQANKRAPDSPDAAERAWIVVKALASLKRFHEARDEAAALAGRYPDSSWAMDAKRHMLVQPLDLPSREEQQEQMQQEQQRQQR
jgi:hypothetical protein